MESAGLFCGDVRYVMDFEDHSSIFAYCWRIWKNRSNLLLILFLGFSNLFHHRKKHFCNGIKIKKKVHFKVIHRSANLCALKRSWRGGNGEFWSGAIRDGEEGVSLPLFRSSRKDSSLTPILLALSSPSNPYPHFPNLALEKKVATLTPFPPLPSPTELGVEGEICIIEHAPLWI